MTSVGWATSLFAFLIFVPCQEVSGGFFEKYCRRPIFKAKKTNLEGDVCTIDFWYRTRSNADAMEYCTGASPFQIKDAKPGRYTVCIFERPHFMCEDNELEVEEDCVTVIGHGSFDQHEQGCGKKYFPYSVKEKMNIIWIAVFFSTRTSEVWAADQGEDAEIELNPIDLTHKAKRDVNSTQKVKPTKAIKFQLLSTFDGIQAGTAIYADPEEKHPFLCARKAILQAEAVDEMTGYVKQLNIDVKTYKDRNGDKRPFFAFDAIHSVDATKFDANFDKFKDICNVFENGYVASHYDFYNIKEYEKAIEELGRFKLYRTTVARGPDKTEPFACVDIDSGELYRKASKIKFNYFLPNNGSTAVVKSDHWGQEWPGNKCADTPRITAVMAKQGYRDIPAIARLPVICTFGNPPGVKLRQKNDVCSSVAHYDAKKGRCVCNNPDDDATVQQPDRYKDFAPGTLCLTCHLGKKTKSFTFIMDQSSTVGEKGMRHEKAFMLDLLTKMGKKDNKKIKAGVAVISCPSYVGLKMKTYSLDEISDWVRGRKGAVGNNHFTGTFEAYEIADEMVKKDKSEIKIVVVLSDGQPSNCKGTVIKDWSYTYPDPWEFKIAKKWREAGVEILYLQISTKYTRNVREIVDDDLTKIISVRDFDALSADIAEEAFKKLCQPEYH